MLVQLHETPSHTRDEVIVLDDDLANLCANEVLAFIQLDDGQQKSKHLL